MSDGTDGDVDMPDAESSCSMKTSYSDAEHARAASEEFAALLDQGLGYGSADSFQTNILNRIESNRKNQYPDLRPPTAPQANMTVPTTATVQKRIDVPNVPINSKPDGYDGGINSNISGGGNTDGLIKQILCARSAEKSYFRRAPREFCARGRPHKFGVHRANFVRAVGHTN